MSKLDGLRKGFLEGKGTEPSVPPPLGPDSTPDDVLDAAARMIAFHHHHRGLAAVCDGATVDLAGGQVRVELRGAQCSASGMMIEYSVTVPGLSKRSIIQPVSFPGTGQRQHEFECCLQQINQGVLAPMLQALGHEWAEDAVYHVSATSATTGQGPIEWDIYSGLALVYAEREATMHAADKLLNGEKRLFETVFQILPGLMGEPGLHWWKVFYSRMPNGTVIGDAWFDDHRSEAGFDEVRALEMPGSDFLMFRQFGILRPSDRPVDMARLQAAIERQGGE